MSTFNNAGAVFPPPHPRKEPEYDMALTSKNLKKIFADCGDFEQRTVRSGPAGSEPVSVCWLDGVVSGLAVSEDVIRPLTESDRLRAVTSVDGRIKLIEEGAVYSYSVKRRETMDDAVGDIVQGFCAVVFDARNIALTFEVRTSNSRSVSEPTVEKTVKGAKDAFVETLRINTSLVRRKLRSPLLKEAETLIGRKSGTKAAVMYVDGVADPKIVESLLLRLDNIDIDGLLASGDIEEYIVDCPGTPFPQLIHTERADKFAMSLLNGRVGLIADGLPIGYLMPATLSSFMRVTEDESLHYITASMLRLLRWTALLLSMLLPGFFVAVAMYHQEMIPSKLLLSMVEAKQGVPFGVATEVILMLATFELLQEAGLRLPDPVGQTVSIIGALIVGQSAVDARVVSPVAVIIVATAGIAGFVLPSMDLAAAVRINRLLVVLCGILAGLFGVAAGTAFIVLRLCSMESFGTPYTHPLTDSDGGVWRTLFKTPLRGDKFRDPAIGGRDRRRQK